MHDVPWTSHEERPCMVKNSHATKAESMWAMCQLPAVRPGHGPMRAQRASIYRKLWRYELPPRQMLPPWVASPPRRDHHSRCLSCATGMNSEFERQKPMQLRQMSSRWIEWIINNKPIIINVIIYLRDNECTMNAPNQRGNHGMKPGMNEFIIIIINKWMSNVI